MDALSKLMQNIPEIDSNTRFWMFRAKKGFFFNEYIQYEFIAIGWNIVTSDRVKGGLSRNQEDILKKEIGDEYEEKLPGAALNKCLKFCNEVKEGDIAMIVYRHNIAFAKIGQYYEESRSKYTVELEKKVHKDIENAQLGVDSFECPYLKRRKIEIIKIIDDETTINPYLFKAMALNRHSLSDLGDYSEIILSSCFDSYIYDRNLTLAFRVKRQNSINAIVLSDFVSSAARIISDNQPNIVAVRTTLHSPGDILLHIVDFVKDNGIPLLVCYMSIFGGKLRDYEFNSIISVIKDIINHDYNKRKQELELRKLSAEVEAAEQDVIAKKLENLEKRKNIQLSMAETYVEPLGQAAEELEIEVNRATIINIQDILRERQHKDS